MSKRISCHTAACVRASGTFRSPGRQDNEPKTSTQRHAAMTWAQRLKRVFKIETCEQCGDTIKVIASIEDPVVIRKILHHLEQRAESTQPLPHSAWGPPLAPSDRS